MSISNEYVGPLAILAAICVGVFWPDDDAPSDTDVLFSSEPEVVPVAMPAGPPPGVIGVEGRVPFDTFAPIEAPWVYPAEQRLAASVDVQCGASGSGALVGQADIVLFAAHQVVALDGTLIDIDQCSVRSLAGGPQIDVDLETLVTGRFVVETGQENRFNAEVSQHDWAVARLQRPMPGVTPYTLPDPARGEGDPGRTIDVVTAGAPQDNFDEDTALAQVCRYEGLAPGGADAPAALYDCDVGRGGSGSAVLAEGWDGQPYLFGIITDSSRGGAPCHEMGREGCFTAGPFAAGAISETISTMASTR